ncbi:hypothetical protein CANARDRAFT_185038, partial [[Candida] arabinofermentans NRRL YB-2248]
DEDDNDSEQEEFRNELGEFRSALGRMFPGASFLDSLGDVPKITSLVNSLEIHQDPFMVLECLNEIAERLLMLNGAVDRNMLSYKFANSIVAVMDNPFYQDELEIQLVACRCLYNRLEVNPDVAHDFVAAGVLEALQSKLIEINYIDLAEQVLQTIEYISRECGRDVLMKGCLPHCLQYLDFFTIHGQRRSLVIAANVCKYVPRSKFDTLKEVFPLLERVATEYSDPNTVENAWLAISRTIKSFEREPQFLEQLISTKLLRRLVILLSTCFSKGKHSNSLLSFSSCLNMLQSLSIIANVSPKLSVILLGECEIGKAIIASLSGYERSDVDQISSKSEVDDMKSIDDKIEVSATGVSVEALMATPKELVISIIKLVAPLLPFTQSGNTTKLIDVGFYEGKGNGTDRCSINKNRIDLYYKNEANRASFVHFINDIFGVLLNIYDSTVDYNIRRLVLICIYRMSRILDKKDLSSIIYDSGITSLLASIIIHGKSILRKPHGSSAHLEEIRPYVLTYGALLITHILISKAPELFLSDFEREGLISNIDELSKALDIDDRVKPDVLPQSDDMDISSVPSSQQCIGDEDMHKEPQSIDDVHQDDESEDQDEVEGDEEEEEDDDEDDEEEGDEDDVDSGSLAESEDEDRYVPSRNVQDYTLESDGTALLGLSIILTEISTLCHEIQNECAAIRASLSTSKSKHFRSIDEVKTLFENAKSFNYTYDQWCTVWEKLARAFGFVDPKDGVISSFELVSSGIISTLLAIFESPIGAQGSDCCRAFQNLFCSSLSPLGTGESLALALFVKKLEEALSRTESFEIFDSGATLYSSSPNTRAAAMAKQIKIKLVSEDDNPSEQNKQLMLVVHAIATFKSVNGFLKARTDGIRGLMRAITNPNSLAGNTSSETPSYIKFSINGEEIPHGTTVYGAIYRSLQSQPNETVPARKIWTNVPHVVHYKRTESAIPEPYDDLYRNEPIDDDFNSLGDFNTISILQILKVLYFLNFSTSTSGASDVLFINYKLTAKLNRQLEEPLVVASGTLPDWSVQITRQFPFLFPIDTRVFFLKSTSFGYSRLINLWQTRSNQEEQENRSNSSLSSNAPQLGRPVRHKLRLSRKHLLKGAIKVLDGYGTIPGLLEIEYFDEAGTGLGPTLEFYANVSKEFSKTRLSMWRTSKDTLEEDIGDAFVNNPTGLFPRPLTESTRHYQKIIHLFSVLGKFVARSLLDSRIIDFTFNPLLFQLGRDLSVSAKVFESRESQIETLRLVDPFLANSLAHLTQYLTKYEGLSDADKAAVQIDGCSLEDLALNFVLPGYQDVQLKEDGEKIDVTHENLEEYIDKVIDMSIGSGVRGSIEAFVSGFSVVFPFSSMSIFYPDEMVRLLGNGEEDWSYDTLISVLHADHGYSIDSPSIQRLLQILTDFTTEERRKFLQFITGSPKLPIGGFKSLHPDLTVVLKHTENGLKPDDYLPSVMTCANYLKLPDYSSIEVMKARLLKAMTEGANSFLLS